MNLLRCSFPLVLAIFSSACRKDPAVATEGNSGVRQNKSSKQFSMLPANTKSGKNNTKITISEEIKNAKDTLALKEYFLKFKTTGNQDKCREILFELIAREGRDAAILFVNETFGIGQQRKFYISAIFEFDNTPLKDLLVAARNLNDEGLKYAAIQALQIRASDWNEYSLDDFVFNQPATDEELLILKLTAQEQLKNLHGKTDRERVEVFEQIASKLIDLQKSNLITNNQLKESIGSLGNLAPFECWSLYNKAFPGEDGSNSKRLIVTSMAVMDPDRAIKSLMADSNPNPGYVNEVVFQMIKEDSLAAKEWLTNNINTYSGNEKDMLSSAFANCASKCGELDVARDWAKQIADPVARNKTEGQIWAVERDTLRHDVAKDPSGTMQAIVNGQSKYGEYWLEEAMGTWISKDFDKAQSWYQENWNKLPASKTQFLAAAFANQAASQGDIATASQWAGYIQDPKTKQRIEAGIAKAEAAKHN